LALDRTLIAILDDDIKLILEYEQIGKRYQRWYSFGNMLRQRRRKPRLSFRRSGKDIELRRQTTRSSD